MNIAVLGACPYPVPQGSQVYLRETALAWREAGHTPHLVTYGYGLGDTADDIPLHRARNLFRAGKTAAGPSLLKPFLDANLAMTLRRVVQEHSIDIVNAHNYEGLIVAIAARTRPIVYHAHNAMADELPYYTGSKDLAATFGRWLDTTFPKRADRIVAPHDRLKDYLVECGCDAERIVVIPPSVDIDAFEQAQPKRTDCPVLYAGNLDEYQNVEMLFPMMERVLEKEPGTQLVIATADSRPIENARVVHTPDFASLRRELKHDVIFACPRASWSGYPIKLLNAMAAGLPIVCCESSAHPITHQYNGLVVPDHDAETFAACILRLMHNPQLRRTYGQRARETAKERHSIETAAEALEKIAATS